MTNEKKQQVVDKAFTKENAKRIQCDFKIGEDRLMMVSHYPKKLDPKTHGPCLITQVFTNGIVRILRNDTVEETVNTHKLYPHKGPQVSS